MHGFAGHAGWGPGQLDHEIARGDWHVTAADATMVFEVKASAIWPKLIQQFSGEWTRRRELHRSSRDARFDLEVGGRSWFFYTVERLGAGDYCRAFA